MNLDETTVDTRIRELLDRTEVTDLVYRLGVCLDEGRFDEMGSLFVEEATARTPGGTAEGRKALVAQAARNHRPHDRIQHLVTNLLAGLDDDRATVRANLVVHFAPPAETHAQVLAPSVQFTLGEVYRFELVRTTGGWRFASVETTPVWMSGSLDRQTSRSTPARPGVAPT